MPIITISCRLFLSFYDAFHYADYCRFICATLFHYAMLIIAMPRYCCRLAADDGFTLS